MKVFASASFLDEFAKTNHQEMVQLNDDWEAWFRIKQELIANNLDTEPVDIKLRECTEQINKRIRLNAALAELIKIKHPFEHLSG